MKNIFNHSKHTISQANKRTNFVILKNTAVISILKNLSKRTSLPANKRTSIFPQLSTINHKLLTFCFVLLFIIVMLIQSGCSLTADRYIERFLGYNSICWEDNDHILIYASIAQYWYNQDVIGGPSKEYDWVGGEIWRITASTGAKELLFRSKDGYHLDNARMYIVNGNVYISGGSTAKLREDFSGWDHIGAFIYPIVSTDERYIVGVETIDLKTIKQYDESNNTENVLYVNDELVTWLDYDYARNYLLINSNKFVDLNTGEERVVGEDGTIIDSIYRLNNPENGKIEEEYITFDTKIRYYDGDSLSTYSHQIRVKIGEYTDREINFGVHGVLSPDKSKYATLGTFTDTLGNMISEWNLPSTEL